MASEHGGTPGRASSAIGQMLPVNWSSLAAATNEPVPGHIKRWWFALGGTPAYCFFIQLTTGILLTFYYVPSPDHAYESVAHISHGVPFGWFVRSIHKWAAHLMVITVILHMCRVYFSCAFRHPRQLNWMIGCCLLLCTVTLGFTGYSLAYEQLSYWGMTVATELVAATPLVGDTLAAFMRGGPEIGANTLTRMFNLHVGILPIAMIGLIGLHVMLIRLHGVSELSFVDEVTAKEGSREGTARSLTGVKLMALLAAAGALGCGFLAVDNRVAVNVIAHTLTLESSRLVWAMGGAILAACSVLLLLGRRYGLLLWLAVSILALGKLVFDLANREAVHTGAWWAATLVLAITVVYGVARQHRFSVGARVDKPFHFFPDHLLTEIIIGTLLLFLLTLLSLVFPAHVGEKANPLVTPEHIKPEWYFFFQFRLLKLMGLHTAVVLTGVLLMVVVLWPFVDVLLERIAPKRDLGVYAGIAGFTVFLVFTVWEALA